MCRMYVMATDMFCVEKPVADKGEQKTSDKYFKASPLMKQFVPRALGQGGDANSRGNDPTGLPGPVQLPGSSKKCAP